MNSTLRCKAKAPKEVLLLAGTAQSFTEAELHISVRDIAVGSPQYTELLS